MRCNHCTVEFQAQEYQVIIARYDLNSWGISSYLCPACNKPNLFLLEGVCYENNYLSFARIDSKALFFPRGANREPCPLEVPSHIAQDYKEACIVLVDSPKASAALSRRCLQIILREDAKVKPSDLAKEIQEVIDSGSVPSYISSVLDTVRVIGNFAAHPIKSKSTGEIVDVEPEEASWNLDVLETLFDFYYVQPAIIRRKKEELNKKLTDAGKPQLH